MDGSSDARVSPTTADVAGHGPINVFVGRFGIFAEQNRGAHDLAGLAVATLRNVDFNPGLLDGVGVIGGEALDGGYMFSGNARERRNAGADGMAVEVYGAGAAQSHAAAKFSAGEAQRIANDP